MTVPPVTSATANNAVTDAFTNPHSALNQTDFLKLLVAQIQYQDPMNPQSDTQMAAQLAQFTSLQQATQSSASLAMMQANNLVGSTVTVQVDSQNTASGVVSGVVMVNGAPQVTVNGANYQLSQIISVKPTQNTNTAAGASSPATPASANPVATVANTVTTVAKTATTAATTAVSTLANAASRAATPATSRLQSNN
ncbi:MAG TPA: flagellar hook capping FlgD N-terminal domain-containing protein [Verrucomicrobiae bacterium]